ncbi:MAG: hypothetical protein KY462_02715 [Actinobacteria bacterium]|nr:hypothetical protein [Actinomycetota bacterium]
MVVEAGWGQHSTLVLLRVDDDQLRLESTLAVSLSRYPRGVGQPRLVAPDQVVAQTAVGDGPVVSLTVVCDLAARSCDTDRSFDTPYLFPIRDPGILR